MNSARLMFIAANSSSVYVTPSAGCRSHGRQRCAVRSDRQLADLAGEVGTVEHRLADPLMGPLHDPEPGRPMAANTGPISFCPARPVEVENSAVVEYGNAGLTRDMP